MQSTLQRLGRAHDGEHATRTDAHRVSPEKQSREAALPAPGTVRKERREESMRKDSRESPLCVPRALSLRCALPPLKQGAENTLRVRTTSPAREHVRRERHAQRERTQSNTSEPHKEQD